MNGRPREREFVWVKEEGKERGRGWENWGDGYRGLG